MTRPGLRRRLIALGALGTIGVVVPCLAGALLRPGAGDLPEDRVAYWDMVPWLVAGSMTSLVVTVVVALWLINR